jgi:hypothetical protein
MAAPPKPSNDLDQELIRATVANDAAAVERLLAAGAAGFARSEAPIRTSWCELDGLTALMAAAEGGNAAIAERLIGVSDPNARFESHGLTALMFAAESGRAQCVRLLAPVSDVFATGRYGGLNALHSAIASNADGALECCSILVERGLLEAETTGGLWTRTPLEIALSELEKRRKNPKFGLVEKALDKIELLVLAGANVNPSGKPGRSALDDVEEETRVLARPRVRQAIAERERRELAKAAHVERGAGAGGAERADAASQGKPALRV